MNGSRFQLLGHTGTKRKIGSPKTYKLPKMFRRARQRHDPMLVLNMSIFNFDSGWRRTFDPIKVHENGAS